MFKIENVHASVETENENKSILNGLNLEIKPGEIHAIMGPNGSGKSTLAKIITGFPGYEVEKGCITLDSQDILEMEPDERANAGIFLAFQYPVEIPGVNNEDFLRMAYNAKQKKLGKEELDPLDFNELIQEKCKLLDIDASFLDRSLNEGFSGGEKKRNEILQMLILEPSVIILDETDSGLDIDALKIVSNAVNYYLKNNTLKTAPSLLVITHYQRLLNYIQPDHVHILVDGKIARSGDKSLALALEESGYEKV